MKAVVVGALVGAGISLAAVGGWWDLRPSFAQRPVSLEPGNGDLVTVTVPAADHRQHVVVLDPKLRAMGVYQVDPVSGEVTLKSVRNFNWDLQMLEFNNKGPAPREIRALVEQR